MAKKKKKKKKRRRTQVPLPPKPTTKTVEIKPVPEKKSKNLKVFLFASLFIIAAAVVFIVLFVLSPRQEQILRNSGLNVLLITLDTTRADRLGSYGYAQANTPNLDFLAANGVRFANAYCQVPLTFPSHCSILTGTTPLYHQVRNNGTYYLAPELQTLAEALKALDMETAAFVSSFTVDSRFGLDQGFDVYEDQFAPGQAFKALNSEKRAADVFAPFAGWLDENRAAHFFAWVHFFDPHIPYDPPSPYREQFPGEPYDGEIAYMDSFIGLMLEKMREYAILDKTLIVVAGDHGEAFGEKQERGHGIFIYEGSMKVPLIFYVGESLPQGRVIEARVRLIDIMPSILDLLDAPPVENVQGISLLPYMSGNENQDLPAYVESFFPRENYGWSELVGLIDGPWKYVKAPREELYNLEQDPLEETNLIQRERRVVQEKKEKLAEIIEKSTSPLVTEKRAMSDEEIQRLRSLGYISFAGGTPKGDLPDPKDRIEEMLMIQEAESYELGQRFQDAEAIYEKLLALRPDVPTSYVNVALMKARSEKMDEAIQILEQGVERMPDSEVLLSRLGHTYMVAGRVKKALDTFDRILKTNPRYFDALMATAWMLDLIGQKEDAQGYYRKTLEVEPENKFARKNYALSLATSGKLNPAIEIYSRLIEDYPDDHEIRKELGIAYGAAGEISRSIEQLEKAVSLHPDPLAYLNLAVAMRKVGKLEDAIRYLKLYLENSEGESEERIAQARAELQALERSLKSPAF
ncbi:MAG: sulfatase-like hydrolase/transferase [Candidatus Aminicenantes bacterium]|nr:MAG: sulfatase-like hydrolase/transferase [Candidatus Aminicenantes bacterium]